MFVADSGASRAGHFCLVGLTGSSVLLHCGLIRFVFCTHGVLGGAHPARQTLSGFGKRLKVVEGPHAQKDDEQWDRGHCSQNVTQQLHAPNAGRTHKMVVQPAELRLSIHGHGWGDQGELAGKDQGQGQ